MCFLYTLLVHSILILHSLEILCIHIYQFFYSLSQKVCFLLPILEKYVALLLIVTIFFPFLFLYLDYTLCNFLIIIAYLTIDSVFFFLISDTKCKHMHCHREYLIILAVVSALILSTTLAVVLWLLLCKRGKKRRRSRKLSDPASLPSWKVFTKEELRSITKNFSEGNRLVGDTKTGGTYSGVQPDGSKVAVKRIKRSSFQRKKEFYSEINRVARLRHPNLVTVVGCCYGHGDRYIVYEFVANGPLDKWLHHIPRGGRSLDWAMRMKIATTLAQGIAYVQNILFLL